MKKIILAALIAVLAISLSGCATLRAPFGGNERPTVITTLFPQYDFVRAIGGDKVDVSLLLPPGVESHSFEPTPRDIANIHRADLFIYTGKYMEPWAARIIDAAQGKPLVVVDASHGVTLALEEKHEDPYEWVGVFELVPGQYRLSFSKIGGQYADPTMSVVLMPVTYSGVDALDEGKYLGKDLFATAAPTTLRHGDKFTPSAKLYSLEFDQALDTSTFMVEVTTAGTFVLLAAHAPAEFAAGTPFFQDAAGGETLPVLQYPAEKDHAHEHGKDPHIWLDPVFAQQMVDNIVAGLSQADPSNADYYRQNGEAFKGRLQSLHEEFATFLATVENRTILYAGHFAFGHFARRYNLEHKSPYTGFSPNAEPTPRRIAELIENVRETQSRVIFYEALVDPRVARVIAEATGARMLLLHGAHNISQEELRSGVTFLSIMEGNLARLREGLR